MSVDQKFVERQHSSLVQILLYSEQSLSKQQRMTAIKNSLYATSVLIALGLGFTYLGKDSFSIQSPSAILFGTGLLASGYGACQAAYLGYQTLLNKKNKD